MRHPAMRLSTSAIKGTSLQAARWVWYSSVVKVGETVLFGKHKRLDESPQGRLRFLCEQEGSEESKLKQGLSELFKKQEGVIRAYLVKVEVNPPADWDVALCVRAGTIEVESLLQEVNEVLSSISMEDKQLHIVLLNRNGESRVASVCRPFFEVSGGKKLGSWKWLIVAAVIAIVTYQL